MATLGTIYFTKGKVAFDYKNYYDDQKAGPPSQKVISEFKLRQAMQTLWNPPTYTEDGFTHGPVGGVEPLQIIRVANTLQPLGTVAAQSVLREYCRVHERIDDTWLFWLERVLFVPKDQNFVFKPPALGLYWQPSNLKEWPTFPVLLIQDVPYIEFHGADLSGLPELYSPDTNGKYLKIRPSLLRPPDDPFATIHIALNKPGVKTYQAMEQVLRLVRQPYKLRQDQGLHFPPTLQEFEQFHQEFLKVRARWSPKLNTYVRPDGSFDMDEL